MPSEVPLVAQQKEHNAEQAKSKSLNYVECVHSHTHIKRRLHQSLLQGSMGAFLYM